MLWRKANGKEIETNNMKDTVEHCVAIGWEPLEPVPQYQDGAGGRDLPIEVVPEIIDKPKEVEKPKAKAKSRPRVKAVELDSDDEEEYEPA